MDNRLLRAKMVLNNDNLTTLAQKLDVAIPTLSRKVSGEFDFKQSEMLKIKELYNLTDAEFIEMFATKV